MSNPNENNIVGVYVKSTTHLYDETLVIRKARLSHYVGLYDSSVKQWYCPKHCKAWKIFRGYTIDEIKEHFNFENSEYIGNEINC